MLIVHRPESQRVQVDISLIAVWVVRSQDIGHIYKIPAPGKAHDTLHTRAPRSDIRRIIGEGHFGVVPRLPGNPGLIGAIAHPRNTAPRPGWQTLMHGWIRHLDAKEVPHTPYGSEGAAVCVLAYQREAARTGVG